MLRMNGTEVASSRSVEEEGGRYEAAVRKSNVRSTNISYDKRTPERLETPYSDVGQVRNALCARGTSIYLVLGLKKRR